MSVRYRILLCIADLGTVKFMGQILPVKCRDMENDAYLLNRIIHRNFMDEFVRKKMEQGIQYHLNSAYEDWKIDKWVDNMWNYENKQDFWYGVVVGTLLENHKKFYKEIFKKEPPVEDYNDFWEIIALHQKEIKEKISSW